VYCPLCGSEMEFCNTVSDIPTEHEYYECELCNTKWEVTSSTSDAEDGFHLHELAKETE